MKTCHDLLDSPLGTLTLVARGDALAAVLFPAERPERGSLSRGERDAAHPVLRRAGKQLAGYFAGELTTFDLPLDPAGTAFQRSVWRALGSIPFGETRSYADIARQLGTPTATRAVGAANGRNPLSIVVPCHRVIGANGALTGFGGGLPAKRWLLSHERGGDLFA